MPEITEATLKQCIDLLDDHLVGNENCKESPEDEAYIVRIKNLIAELQEVL